MKAITRHALGLGIVLFLGGAFLTVSPVSASSFGCGSTIWPRNDTVRQVETVTPEGEVLVLPKAEDLEARSDCHSKRQTQTTVAISLAVAGLIGVFWSVIAAPDAISRRSSRGLVTSR